MYACEPASVRSFIQNTLQASKRLNMTDGGELEASIDDECKFGCMRAVVLCAIRTNILFLLA